MRVVKETLFPGTANKSFKIELDRKHLVRKGDILLGTHGVGCKVIRAYPFTWWRKLLLKIGIPFKSMELVKVKLVINQ